MKVDYAEALRRVLVFEGGKVDHPRDPGGRTNQGVTQHVYNGYRVNKGLPQRDVFLIADADVAATGGGIVSTVLDQFVNALSPLFSNLPMIGTVVGVITAVGGIAATAGLAYRWYATRKAKALADALDTRHAPFVAGDAPPPVNDNHEPEAVPVPEASAEPVAPAAVEPEHHEAAMAAAAAAAALAQTGEAA